MIDYSQLSPRELQNIIENCSKYLNDVPELTIEDIVDSVLIVTEFKYILEIKVKKRCYIEGRYNNEHRIFFNPGETCRLFTGDINKEGNKDLALLIHKYELYLLEVRRGMFDSAYTEELEKHKKFESKAFFIDLLVRTVINPNNEN